MRTAPWLGLCICCALQAQLLWASVQQSEGPAECNTMPSDSADRGSSRASLLATSMALARQTVRGSGSDDGKMALDMEEASQRPQKNLSSKIIETHRGRANRSAALPVKSEKTAEAVSVVVKAGSSSSRLEQPGGHDDPPRRKRRPWEQEDTSALTCGTPAFAPSAFRCPKECPMRKPDQQDGCSWACVPEDQCIDKAPGGEALFADVGAARCRECDVIGCRRCKAGEDICEECMPGFQVTSHGACKQRPMMLRRIFVSMLLLALVVVVVVYLMFICADHINMFNLHKAMEHRERATMRSLQENHRWYDLFTDLRRIPPNGTPPVGGPGLMLLFNYQFSILVWGTIIVVGWMWLALAVSPSMLLLGTTAVEDPVEVCKAVRWGEATREHMRLAKTTFVGGIYILSTVLALCFSLQQKQRFEEVDSACATMMDYAAQLDGFPKEYGPDVERRVSQYIREVTGLDFVGVSIAWDFGNHMGEVLSRSTHEIRKREVQLERARGDLWEEDCAEELSAVRRRHLNARVWCYYTYCLLLGKMFEVGMGRRGRRLQGERSGRARRSNLTEVQQQRLQQGDEDEEEPSSPLSGVAHLSIFDDTAGQEHSDGTIEDLLSKIGSSGTVFAVFETESDRDQAIAAFARPDAKKYIGEHTIVASSPGCDPENIAWENYCFSWSQLLTRIAVGIVFMVLAIIFWTVAFYAPYAQLEIAAYSNAGTAPPFIYEFVFSLVVCVGNLALYLFCSLIAEHAGFRSRERAHAAYLVLYTLAVFCNIAVDISISAAIAYWWLTAQNVRTDDGVLLQDLPDFTSLLMSYPMQKALGRMLWSYNFPTSFLLPYICESIGIIAVPYHLGYRVVISYKMPRPISEMLLEPMPMDLSRYGDILVNVTLATLSLFLSSGWVLWNFIGLLIGNAYIFCYDQYRVLRHVGQFYFSCSLVDAICRQMLSVPCGLMAACFIFQLYGMGVGGVTGRSLWVLMAVAFFGHVCIHLLLYRLVVDYLPALQQAKGKKPNLVPYKEAAKRLPGNWFTENPVHCLRSQYIRKDNPPCMIYVKGKEYNIPKNESIGLHYSCPPPRYWDAGGATEGKQQPAG